MDWSHWGPDDRSSRLVEQAPVEALSLLLRVGSSQWPLLPGEVLGFGSSPPAILRFFHVGTYLLLALQKTPVPRLFKSLAYVFWSILNWISWCWLSFYRFQGFPGSHHGSRIWIPQRRVFQLVPLKSSRNATSWDPFENLKALSLLEKAGHANCKWQIWLQMATGECSSTYQLCRHSKSPWMMNAWASHCSLNCIK